MRKVTFGGANSLDNFLARPDDAVDWLMWSDEAAEVTMGFWATIDTVIMGRKTYEVAVKNGQGGGSPGVRSIVFSRTLTSVPAGVELVKGDPVGFVRRLREEPGKDICLMGGGDLARPLLEAGLIDEIGFNIHPVLLGAGIPAFHPMNHQVNLALLECRPFKNGCVYVRYRVEAS